MKELFGQRVPEAANEPVDYLVVAKSTTMIKSLTTSRWRAPKQPKTAQNTPDNTRQKDTHDKNGATLIKIVCVSV